MTPQISKRALKLTEKARAAAEEGVILVSRKRKGSNTSVANADTRDIATHTAAKIPAKRVKANPRADGCSNPVLNVRVQQEVVVINSDIGGCKHSHGQKPPGREEESSDADVEEIVPEEGSSDVEEVEPEKEETAEDELSMSLELQNVHAR